MNTISLMYTCQQRWLAYDMVPYMMGNSISEALFQ